MMAFLVPVEFNSIILGLSATAALIAIWRNHIISRRKATIDLIILQSQNEVLIQANKSVNARIHKGNGSILELGTEENLKTEDAQSLFKVLNNYEFIASAIREGALDFKLYKRMRYKMTLRDWGEFEGFVVSMRKHKDHETLYQEFEWLANKIKRKPLRPNKAGRRWYLLWLN